ncbi:hypothetical protein FNV43_RR07225 [Rhamnella rubrinervis]|uniref:Uncharacterized protein n=1 Tax=Rhamnella rubrinervis TaxID=2594499 RepID=A0A8K0HEY4_9ROSA|nr:hypothetical protein FNV43_RR07225 [Rhamnella rubrinervis]
MRLRLMHTVNILHHLHELLPRLCAIEERLSIMDNKQSSMDNKQSSMDNRLSSMESRLSSMESRLDSLMKLLSSTYNTTRVQLDEDDDQCFDEVRGEDVGVGDAHRMCDKRINHAANHLVPPRSISPSHHESESTVTFDPYRSVPDEIARQYAHFINMSADDQTVELFWITVGKKYFKDMECSLNWLTSDRVDKYPEVLDSRILLLDNRLSQYMEARLDFFNENKETYDFGEEILEFLNGKEPMMKIKSC